MEQLEDDQSTEVPHLRRSTRVSRPPERFIPSPNYLFLADEGEPECLREAKQVEDSSECELAMRDERVSLRRNETWDLLVLPPRKKALQNKSVYHLKNKNDGLKRYKVILVVKGFKYLAGIDYIKIFAPVVKLTTTCYC